MDQTAQLKIEFFELIRLLNQSNQTANQKTEISFFLESRKHKSILYATTNKIYKMQLIYKSKDVDWRPCGFCRLDLLEKELSKLFSQLIREEQSPVEITKIIKSFVFKQFDEK